MTSADEKQVNKIKRRTENDIVERINKIPSMSWKTS